ncbi:citrate lyase holo-[acyl-carrier protein] synthase [Lactobacillus corticis]|uniref:citrate lyase holo-[acyl-carrier protein] synthase n=1 Tax=Lactobacillus corticis TaxID=2201249 RepID=A0A916QJS2_9LACO|nr:citrate lyase holo-[acyl-carrier protein] synthase [Lactobacillus corticis]GFZ27652.1 apo-citrate lyase phosphoribosyl-dephospho-CoA transferase [Lactobacillus corticis]
MKLFDQGIPVDIMTVLNGRDKRANFQEKLLQLYPNQTIIGAKLNIAGPIKNNSRISQFFQTQMAVFESLLAENALTFERKGDWSDAVTGPEYFYVVDQDPLTVKKLAVKFEEAFPARRLFDIDVHYLENNQERAVSRTELGLARRKCLICGRDAKTCGRARRHQVAELEQRTAELINNTLS